MEQCTYKISITGTVQGVGFRPFIFSLSQRYVVTGTVNNNASGVEIILNTDSLTLKQFLIAVEYEYPPLASIDTLECNEVEYQEFEDFQIIETEIQDGDITTNIPPDISICTECEKELLDPKNRRYGYPFITCTHCGVRYSIIYDLPYDRKHTSMKSFEMCVACEEEYSNALDRRYHAQPIGCYDCGPSIELLDDKGLSIESSTNVIDKVIELIDDGHIVAIKGVGGYHFICDATNEDAIVKLRQRKNRPSKPLAVMAKNIEMAKSIAFISEVEEKLLVSKERPIVILKEKEIYSKAISPNSSFIGVFLPYTPLHLLLLDRLNRPIVATSANVTDEPICTNLESLQKLAGVYDYVLEHNRDIVNGCDDSVVMVVKEEQIILRRARGYAPISIKLPISLKENVLALGANQKSTIAIGFDNQAILSPHIGDLDGIASVAYYEKNIETLKRVYNFKPKVIAYDKHPRYESTKVAQKILKNYPGLKAQDVQHHYAHILAVMAEQQIQGKVFGIAFDGTGYGDDGNLWGGEFMVCDYEGYERVAHLEYFKLLGGAKAIKEPRRVALSFLFNLFGKDVLNLENPTTNAFSKVEIRTYYTAWEKGLNAPLSSSVGRLFDSIASLLGICQVMSFEGESGMMLEELFDSSVNGHYSFTYANGKIDILPLISELLEEKNTVIAVSKFFHTLVEIIATVYKPYNLPLVVSGGVFQNRVLLGLVLDKFPKAIISNSIPVNDGGIALGQVIATVTKQRS